MEVTVSFENDLDKLIGKIEKLNENMEKLEKRTNYMEMLLKANDLDPYEPQESLKQKLGIGQGLLNEWVAKGLEKQIWSDRNVRYDREELRQFLKKEYAV
nr:MAG: Pyocin activator protein PrtN [Bacteriophage sp.]